MNTAVRIERDDCVATLTLDRPDQRNVLSVDMVQAIGAAFDELENDGVTQCVVITGAGRAFCAGAELSSLRAAADGDFDIVESVYDGFLRVLHSPLATIAAVNGPAVGAGFNLALACDVRLAGSTALFDTRFAQLRLHPGGGHVWMLTRAVGRQQAMLACVFGQTWGAADALANGLVASVHDDAELGAAAVAIGKQLSGLEPLYTRRLTETVRESFETLTHAEALALETEKQRWSSTRPAFRQGVDAIEARIAQGRR